MTKHTEIYARLRELAPSIAFSASKEIDRSFLWDGDGPDPITEGFDPYDVTWTARAIIGGKVIEGKAFLGGSYFSDGEEVGDCDGYTQEKLIECAINLLPQLDGEPVSLALESLRLEIGEAHAYLIATMRRDYDEQRAAIHAKAHA